MRTTLVFVGFLLVTFVAAGIGGWFTGPGVRNCYPALHKPTWTPPVWLFGPIWTALYLGHGPRRVPRLASGGLRRRSVGNGVVRDPVDPQRGVVVGLLWTATAGMGVGRNRRALGGDP